MGSNIPCIKLAEMAIKDDRFDVILEMVRQYELLIIAVFSTFLPPKKHVYVIFSQSISSFKRRNLIEILLLNISLNFKMSPRKSHNWWKLHFLYFMLIIIFLKCFVIFN